VLLTTLFVSSCYWQPFPIDSPLTIPWSQNITTFSEALIASISTNYSQPLPTVMRAVDRCWCDFSGNFFEPFNVSHWEYQSVLRVGQDLERQQKLNALAADAEEKSMAIKAEGKLSSTKNSQSSSSTSAETVASTSNNLWSRFRTFGQQTTPKSTSSQLLSNSPKTPAPKPHPTPNSGASPPSDVWPPFPDSRSPQPVLRREYDLRPYGIGMIIDLGWAR